MTEKHDRSTLKNLAISSFKWSVLSEALLKFFQPLSMLILAKFLTPSDFGIIGIATTILSVALIIQDFGLSKALINDKKFSIQGMADSIFFFYLTLAIIIYIIFILLSPLFPQIFHENDISVAILLLGLQLFFMSYNTLQISILTRELKLKKIFVSNIIYITTFFIVAFSINYYIRNYLSIIIGTIIANAFQFLYYWVKSEWRFSLNFNWNILNNLLKFGYWPFLESIMLWILYWGDSLIIGHFIGPHSVGVYRIVLTILLSSFGLLLNPLLPVVYSGLSKIDIKRASLNILYIDFLKILLILASIIPLSLYFMAPIIESLLGQKWHGLEEILTILLIKDSIGLLVTINPEILRAIGHHQIYPKIWLFLTFIYLPIYFYFSQFGLTIFCWSRLGVSIFGTLFQLSVLFIVLKIPIIHFINRLKNIFISFFIFIPVAYFIKNNLLSNYNIILSKLMGLFVSSILLVIIFSIFERESLIKSFNLIKLSLLKKLNTGPGK